MTIVDHSILPPSSAAQRMACSGYWKLEKQFSQDENSESAREGILAHDVAQMMLMDIAPPENATAEMIEGGELWADYCSSLPGMLKIESRVSCGNIHPEMWGTPDLWTFDADKKILHVADYKYGHVRVEAEENWQCLCYALGVLYENHLGEVTVRIHIVQPRHYGPNSPIRTWDCSWEQLKLYLLRLQSNSTHVMSNNAMAMSGKHCRFCSARHACDTLNNAVSSVLDEIGKPIAFELTEMQLGNQLAHLNAAIDLVKARLSGLEDDAISRIQSGKQVPGWAAQRGATRIKWSVPVEQVLALGEMLNVDVSKPGLITPTQAVKKGLPQELVNTASSSGLGELTLVPFKTQGQFK